MTVLYFLAFAAGGVLGMFLAHAIGSVALNKAGEERDQAYEHAARCESSLIEAQVVCERAEAALAARIARDSRRGQNAARTRKARREAAALAAEVPDTVTDPDLLPADAELADSSLFDDEREAA